jgi:hypothetical protein
MSLPRLVSPLVVSILFSTAMFGSGIPTASCSFTTFSVPSGYTLIQVAGVNNDGTVVGQLIDNKTQNLVGFSYSSSGVFTEYTVPKSLTTWMYGLNASGLNAGSYQGSKYPDPIYGFLLQDNQLTTVAYPKALDTWVFDVNQAGAIVGSFSPSVGVTKGFLLANGKYTTIAYPNAQVTYAQAINENGAVVGSYSSSIVSNGFLWQDGKFTTIDFPKSKYGSELNGINDSGVIVGNHFSGDFAFGFIYENGGFEKIVYDDARYTSAGGINDNGLISGQIFFTGGDSLGYTATCK